MRLQPLARAGVILALMVLAFAASRLLTPRVQVPQSPAELALAVPKQFGDWHEVPSLLVQASLAVNTDDGTSNAQPYDQVLLRTYQDNAGHLVMLALAYSTRQSQDVRVHKPDVCYSAQGYVIKASERLAVSITTHRALNAVPVTRLLTEKSGRTELVSYWIRTGNFYSSSGPAVRWHLFKEALKGRVPDGILVRASQLVTDTSLQGAHVDDAFKRQEHFLAALYQASPDTVKQMLLR